MGCDQAARNRAEQSESIFGAFVTTPRPVDAVMEMNDPFDPGKRLRGMLLIANAPFGGEEVYVKGYAKALGGIDGEPADTDPGVRAVAARALALHGGPEHVPLMLPLVSGKRERVERLEGVRALQRLHSPKAVDPLIDATDPRKEPEHEVRAEACTALGQYAETRVLQALIRGVDDDQLVVNRAAEKSLTILTGQELGDDRRAWLAWLEVTKEPFALRRPYFYPVFARDKTWIEYLPFVQPPPNEKTAKPAGMAGA